MSSLPSLFIAEFFCKNIFSLKKNIFILLESNMHKQTPAVFWDLICPTSIVGENFFLFKNYSGLATKSLFLRLGIWYSRSTLNFLKSFILIKNFPFFWFSSAGIFFSSIISLFFHFWIVNTFTNFVVLKVNNIFLKETHVLKENAITFNSFYFKFFILNFVNRNFWFSRLSFINSSKYSKLGYTQLKKERMTFLQLTTT